MKNLFKNPLFYINVFLLILFILLSVSINPNSTNLPSFAKKALAAVANILGEGTVNYLAAFKGVHQIGNSIIYDTGTNIGIGTTAPGAKLDVVGTARMTGFQLGTSATAGHVLTTNASGVGTWQAAAGGASGGGGVSQIIAGTNITISPTSGTGVVTINSTGGTGGAGHWALSGANIYNTNTGRVIVGGTTPYPGALDGAQMSIKSAAFNRAALYWGVGDTLVGFLGVRDGNTALVGAAHLGNDLIFRTGGVDRVIIRRDNAIGWYNTDGVEVGFLGHNRNDALVGAHGLTGGNLRLRAGNKDIMTIEAGGSIRAGGPGSSGDQNIYARDYYINAIGKWASQLGGGTGGGTVAQGTLVGLAMIQVSSCSGSGVVNRVACTRVFPPMWCDGVMPQCPSGYTRWGTGTRIEPTACYQLFTCVKN